jgi:hypothetical protein
MNPSQIVTDVVRSTIRPYLRERGFTGTGPRFERPVGETVQHIWVQKAKFDGVKGFVYVNGTIDLPELDDLLGRPEPSSEEPRTAISLRSNQVDESVSSEIVVTQTSEPDDVLASMTRCLEVVLGKLDEITTTEEAVDYLSHRMLAGYQGVFGWYLHHRRLEQARAFVTGLHDYFGEQPRWKIFASKLDAVAEGVAPGTNWRAWLDHA